MNTTAVKFLAVGLLLAGTGTALAEVHYVDLNSTNATPPYTNWTAAATNIQDAVDAAVAADEIVVTNGRYGPITIREPMTVGSVNGALFTTIDGGGAWRCVSANSDTIRLSGFTLANGVDTYFGGGAYGCTLNNCTLIGNRVFNIYVDGSKARGGGAYQCTLNNCILNSNSVNSIFSGYAYGGGAYGCILNNCTLSGNDAAGGGLGGGTAFCTLNNCTLTGNTAHSGGGTFGCTLTNCLVYFNGGNWYPFSPYRDSLNYCCTTPQPPYGFGNITNAPLFADPAAGDLRLQSNSPCINAGNNAYAPASTDLDGNPRIVGGTVDIGAYEFQAPVSQISYAWLQQYGLPINSSTDPADPDGDAVDNYHEWLAGTDPTNPFSSPAQLTIIPSGTSLVLAWSTNAVGFTLQSTTNLGSPVAWSSNFLGPVVVNGQKVVTNPISGPPQFYRLRQ